MVFRGIEMWGFYVPLSALFSPLLDFARGERSGARSKGPGARGRGVRGRGARDEGREARGERRASA